MKYEILECSEISDLEKEVKKMIEQGWLPQGGVSVAMSESDDFRYFTAVQAMIKIDKAPQAT